MLDRDKKSTQLRALHQHSLTFYVTFKISQKDNTEQEATAIMTLAVAVDGVNAGVCSFL